MIDLPDDELKYIYCTICGRSTPVNANYPINQVTCFRCHMEKKWQAKESR